MHVGSSRLSLSYVKRRKQVPIKLLWNDFKLKASVSFHVSWHLKDQSNVDE